MTRVYATSAEILCGNLSLWTGRYKNRMRLTTSSVIMKNQSRKKRNHRILVLEKWESDLDIISSLLLLNLSAIINFGFCVVCSFITRLIDLSFKLSSSLSYGYRELPVIGQESSPIASSTKVIKTRSLYNSFLQCNVIIIEPENYKDNLTAFLSVAETRNRAPDVV